MWGEDAVVRGTLVCDHLKNQLVGRVGLCADQYLATLEIQRVVQDEPPKKRRGREVDVWKTTSYDTLLAKNIRKSIGSTPYFLNIKYVFIFELASIS